MSIDASCAIVLHPDMMQHRIINAREDKQMKIALTLVVLAAFPIAKNYTPIPHIQKVFGKCITTCNPAPWDYRQQVCTTDCT